MLIFNLSRAGNRVNDKRALFKVRYSIKVPRTPSLRLGQVITLTGYSIVLA